MILIADCKKSLGLNPVNVINTRNGRTVQVGINDRGPFVEGRIIDLSVAAARERGMLDAGLTEVCIMKVDD